jgi:hypothetical protein
MKNKTSLSEVMGKKASDKKESLRLDDLSDILGEAMPELPKNNVGRFRLIRALQQRFGRNFKTLPGVKNLLHEFDEDVKYEQVMNKLKAIKPKKKEA